ncbi:hypothetical protein HPO96_08280 [Kribbella sandramycini]|uniref:Uncharacterized protein n=1 Tax=Kribbella sandramycini TaxID=60450 RepID=A0A7Y4KX28_9ACTN|nr:hypothetical protein [Kribbella sandramycini]
MQRALPNAAGKTFTSQVVDFPPATTYQPGEYWYEEPGAHHVIAANASTSEDAKLLVVYVSTTGDALQADDSR